RQLHPPDALRELLAEVGRDLLGKARFAAASSTGESEQPGSHEQPSDRGQLAFAANKPVHLERQIVRRGVAVLWHCAMFHGMPSSSSRALACRETSTDLTQAGGEIIGPLCDGIATPSPLGPRNSAR